MKPESIRLFIKEYCGWCHEAVDWFKATGLPFETLEVTSDPAAWDEMQRLSGQTKAPVVEVDGEVLADFGVDELEKWWVENGFSVE